MQFEVDRAIVDRLYLEFVGEFGELMTKELNMTIYEFLRKASI